MQAILECCCGVDVHKDMIEACIIQGIENPKFIRQQFSTMQNELQEFVRWLYDNDCYHIAMESTGVYWRPVYECIEEFSPYYEDIIVANAHHMRNLPGRKTDVKDAEWIATLLQHGLLEKSYVPSRNIRDLRELSRSYKNYIGERVRCINRLEKFLQTHGFKLSSVLSDITSVSGINILTLLSKRGSLSVADIKKEISSNTKHSAEEISLAVSGRLSVCEQFLLSDFLSQLHDIDKHINDILAVMASTSEPYKRLLDQLDSIPGIDITAAMLILAEIGPNPQEVFKTSARLCSWAGLSPRNDQSAGKISSKKIMPGNPYIKSILCQSAWAAVRSRNTPFGAWFWSRQAKIGTKKAIIGVSRRLLSTIFVLLKNDQFYDSDIAMRSFSA